MEAKHSFVLKYKLDQRTERFGLITTDPEFVFFESKGEVDFAAVEKAAKQAWLDVLAEVRSNTAFKARDPKLTCVSTFSGVAWE